jgi:hypothetical protein
MRARVVIAIASAGLSHACFAQWAVFDAVNLSQSVTNYGVMVEQLARQADQIANQVRQIQHMEDRLKRLGNMADVKVIVGFPELSVDLNLPTQVKVWAENAGKVNGVGIFGDTRDGIFRPIVNEFPDFDGTMIIREPDVYKPAHDITTKVDEFKVVQEDVYLRRDELRKAISRTSEALRTAETEAEELKLKAILDAQYDQLAAIDSEVTLSAAEIQVRAAESAAMVNAQNEADAETRRTLAQQEARKIGSTFKPLYGSVLLYVKEEPFKP